MARNFLTPINLSGLEIQDAAIQGKTTAAIAAITPTSGGRIYYDSQLNVLKLYNGSSWVSVATGGSTFTLGSTSVAIGATVTTVAGLTLSAPTFTGTITTSLTTAGYVTTTSGGVLSSVATIPNSGLTNNTISGIALGSNLAALTIGTGLSGTSYNGSTAVTIAHNTNGTAGTYAKVTTDAYGHVTSGTTLSASDIPQLGNITNAGAIGSTTGLVVSTTTSGVLTASNTLPNGTLATTQSAADNSTKVATTAYVETAVSNAQAGFNVHGAVLAASTANVTGTYTNGAPDNSQGTGIGATFVFTAATIDGVTLTPGMRVLLKNQTIQTHNGIYTVTAVAANITLTRATDFDNSTAGEVFAGDLVYVGGTGTQAGTSWVMNSNGTATTPLNAIKIGTDNLNWVQFAGAGTYTGSNGVSVTGTAIAGVNATTSSVGVASFPTAQFTVASGAVTIANLSAAVILSGTLAAARGGTGADLSGANSTQYGLPYFTSAGVMASTAAGTNAQVLIGNAAGAPTWTNISGLTVSAASTATTATNATNSAITNDVATPAPVYPVWSTNNSGNNGLKTSSAALSFVPSTGTLSATVFSGSGASLTSLPAGNLTGTVSSARGITSGSATASFLGYNGTTALAGQLDGGTTAPTGTTRLNYGGYLYATQFYGDGSNLTSLAAANLSGTIATGVLGNSSLFVGTTSIALNRASANQALTGVTGLSVASVATATGTGLTFSAGVTTYAAGPASGGAISLTAGNATGNNTGLGSSGGAVIITAGSSTTATDGAGGDINLTPGTGTGGNGSVVLNRTVKIPTLGTSGFVKLSTGGLLVQDTTTYLTSGTGVTTVNGASGAIGATANSNGAITRYYRATNSSGTSTVINHALGQWVLVQVYKTSDGTLVDTDVANTSASGGTTTVTFAVSQTAGDYTIVIIG